MITIRSIVIAVALCCSMHLQSQSCLSPCSPYAITNLLSCQITVDWEIVDSNCGLLCWGSNVLILGNNAISLTPGACCTGAFDINVYVKSVGGITYPTTGYTAQSQAVAGTCHCNSHGSDGGTCHTSCNSGSFSIAWGPSGTTIY
jgi:hypothetical protein